MEAYLKLLPFLLPPKKQEYSFIISGVYTISYNRGSKKNLSLIYMDFLLFFRFISLCYERKKNGNTFGNTII
jgi:hypothetical protein